MASAPFTPSGELNSLTAEELVEADTTGSILCYTHGIAGDDRPYYVYIAVKPSRYAEFKRLTDAGKGLVLGEYGEIILGGFEAEPPPNVVTEMREKYGFDEHYTGKLLQKIKQEQKVFVEQKETKRINDIVAMLKKRQPAK